MHAKADWQVLLGTNGLLGVTASITIGTARQNREATIAASNRTHRIKAGPRHDSIHPATTTSGRMNA